MSNATWRSFISRPALYGFLTGFAYGIALRALALLGHERSSPFTDVMTWGFMFIGPVVLGFLTVRPHPNPSWWFRLFGPWLPTYASLQFMFLYGWEGGLCILMALPVVLPLAMLGGVIGGLRIFRGRREGLAAALLPFVVMPIEQLVPAPDEVHRLESEIAIHAPAAAVWEEVVEVPEIVPAEQRPALFTRLGFPRPVSATIDRRGVGGIRRARFERGVLFLETVTHYEPARRLRFTIAAQTDSIPPETLDRHVTIGGPYFDVLVGEYTLEPTADGVILHLASELRVSTRFNFYAKPWVDAIMLSIQENILAVVRERAERRAVAQR